MANFFEIVKGFGMLPNKIFQKVRTDEILKNARVGTAAPCLLFVISHNTPYALRRLVKAVYVEAPDKSGGKRKQKIYISCDLIGFIPVDVLTKAEQA